jgi:hypothetical protein
MARAYLFVNEECVHQIQVLPVNDSNRVESSGGNRLAHHVGRVAHSACYAIHRSLSHGLHFWLRLL